MLILKFSLTDFFFSLKAEVIRVWKEAVCTSKDLMTFCTLGRMNDPFQVIEIYINLSKQEKCSLL